MGDRKAPSPPPEPLPQKPPPPPPPPARKMADAPATFQAWCIVELMGHRRLAGWVTEQTIAGAGFLRVDVTGPGPEFVATQFFQPTSVYALTPTTEAMARRIAEASRVEPVKEWELPRRPALEAAGEDDPDKHDGPFLGDEEPF